MNQSIGILRYLCAEAGLVARTPNAQYDVDFYFELKDEFDRIKGISDGYWKEGATEEEIKFTVEQYGVFFKRLDARFSLDMRPHVAGSEITAADFNLLSFYTSVITNKGINTPETGIRLGKVLARFKHLTRVIDNIKNRLKASVDKLPSSRI